MSTQFDDLLADFGDTSNNTNTVVIKSASNGTADEFDPFGFTNDLNPVTTTNGGDSGLLLDFTPDSQKQNGDTVNGIDFEFQMNNSTDASSANPLYEMSVDTQSSNPLYDLSSGSANPLYDLTTDNSGQSSNPLYDFTSDPHKEEPANPLYEFDNSSIEFSQVQAGLAEPEGTSTEEDLLGMSQETYANNNADTGDKSLGDDLLGMNQETYVNSSIDPGATLFGDETLDIMDQLNTETQDEIIINEEEPISQDGVNISSTSTENAFTDSGPETLPVSPTQTFSSDQWADRVVQNGEPERVASEQEVVPHFTEMASVTSKFDSEPEAEHKVQVNVEEEVLCAEGGVYENEPQTFTQWQNEEEEEGVYESKPITRDDVVREADKADLCADLPALGTAKSLKAKFMSGEVESSSVPRQKREITPPAHGTGGEFVSEPRTILEKYEGKAEAGVFESQPQVNEEVVSSYTPQQETLPEQGFAKNVAARFKEMEKSQGTSVSPTKREITPDRSGRVEFVSEPRNTFEHYEVKPESGVFESKPEIKSDVVRSGEEVEEQLPERGMAKSLASKFIQISAEGSQYSSPRGKREITPDTLSRGEYVSEPRSQTETYEPPKVDAGVFENQPSEDPNVVKADSLADDYVPETGFARNVAAKFREMENSAKSPTSVSPGRRKEFTPPRETVNTSGVVENTPEIKLDVVKSGETPEEALPERGAAKNMAQRFREMENANSSPTTPKPKKEFTPPPNSNSVFESKPDRFQEEYNHPAESGIIENTPAVRVDVVRGDEPPKYEEELPERGFAKKLVGTWRQMESQSAKSPGSAGRTKEFTPPRDEPRIIQARKSPRTPMSPNGQMGNGSVHPSELPDQYQQQNEPSVFESTPDVLTDVVSENDTDWMEGMPKKDAAKKMLAKFQSIQEKAKSEEDMYTPKKESESESSEQEELFVPVHSKQAHCAVRNAPVEPVMENARLKFEDPDKVGRSKSMRAAIQVEKCGACDKTVYAMERLEMNKRVYHRACFRCSQCKTVLTPKTFSINNEIIFCTTHYKQMFQTKGNYDEGFGRTQHKKLWSSQANLASGETNGSSSPTKS